MLKMFHIIPRQVMARRMVPLAVRGIAPGFAHPLHRQTARFFHDNDKKGPSNPAEKGAEPHDPKPTREDEILQLRQKLYQTNTWHEADQLRKQLRQEGEEVAEESPKAVAAAVEYEEVEQQHQQQQLQQDEKTPDPPKAEAAVKETKEAAETTTITENLERITLVINRIREAVTSQDKEEEINGLYRNPPATTVTEPGGHDKATAAANEGLDLIEALVERIREDYEDREAVAARGEEEEEEKKKKLTANDLAGIFSRLERSKIEMGEMSRRLDGIAEGLERVEGVAGANTERIGRRERRGMKTRGLRWALIVWGVVVLLVLPPEVVESFVGGAKGQWEDLQRWKAGMLHGEKKTTTTTVTTAVDEGGVVVEKKTRPEREVRVGSYPSSLRRRGDEQRLSMLSKLIFVFFWFICWAGRFPRFALPSRVIRDGRLGE